MNARLAIVLLATLSPVVAGAIPPGILPPEWTDPYPPSFSNECRGVDLTYGSVCVAVPTGSPTLPLDPPVPDIGPGYYLYVPFARCLRSPLSWDCRGHPDPQPGTELPTGQQVCPCVIGAVWQETNGYDGLQRYRFSWYGLRYPDHLVLV